MFCLNPKLYFYRKIVMSFSRNLKTELSDTKDIIEWSFNLARKYFPNEVLVINEGNPIPPLSRDDYRNPYYMMIENSLQKGTKIDKIGLSKEAYLKAKNVLNETKGDRIVIGSDTIVVKNGKIYGKPSTKENAKQMALSEREELGRLREELKRQQQEGGSLSPVVDAVREMTSRLYEEIHDNGEAVLAELGTTLDSLEEIKDVIEALGTNAPMTFDRTPVMREEESVAEEEPEEEEESVAEEPVAEEKPEDALASSGVDLSDPNKTLSADDIAALFAAMGN